MPRKPRTTIANFDDVHDAIQRFRDGFANLNRTKEARPAVLPEGVTPIVEQLAELLEERRQPEPKQKKPLSDAQKATLAVIREHGSIKAKKLATFLHPRVSYGNLTRHILKELTARRLIVNHRGCGYSPTDSHAAQ